MGMRDRYRGFKYGNRTYDSLSEVLRDYEINRSVYYRVRRETGMCVRCVLDYILSDMSGSVRGSARDVIEYGGDVYDSLNELCATLSSDVGIKSSTLYARINRGMSIDDALGIVGRVAGGVEFPVTFRGFEYETQGLLLEDWEIPYSTVYRYQRAYGFNVLEAAEYYLNRNGK